MGMVVAKQAMNKQNQIHKKTRSLSSEKIKFTILLACVLIGFAFGFMGESVRAVPNWLLAFVIIGLGVVTLYYWRLLDETAREAHKFSWYWGSSLGIFFALLICLAALVGVDVYSPVIQWYGVPETFDQIFLLGGLSILVLQVIGYLLVWTFWWLRMR